MIPKFLILLAILICGFAFALWDTQRPPPMAEIAAHADYSVIDNAELTALDGTVYHLHDFQGKTVLLNFWATWCPPCVAEFPDLLHIAQKRQDDLVLVAVSVDAQAQVIPAFLDKLPASSQPALKSGAVLVMHDANGEKAREIFNVTRYPETYVIDPTSRVRRKISGALTPEDIRSLLAAK